jgi:hypothetical protein
MVGCRMEQACSARAEKAVEVGRNDKDGTCLECGNSGPKEVARDVLARTESSLGVDARAVCRRRGSLWRTPREESEPAVREVTCLTAGSRTKLAKTARCVTRLRRGREGHEGPSALWLTRAKCCRFRAVPRRSRRRRGSGSRRKAREVERGRPTTRDPRSDV